MTLALKVDILSGEYARQTEEASRTMAQAASAALRDVGDRYKREVRAEAARAGFSRRWQNTLRVNVFPKPPAYSLDSAIFLRSQISYSEVFETGETLRGSPYMWAPLSSTPKKQGRLGKRLTPSEYIKSIGNLVPMRSKSGNVLLAAPVKATDKRIATGKVSLSLLRRGLKAKRGKERLVPLFVGIKQVSIPDRLDVYDLGERARDRIPAEYAQEMVRLTNG